MPPTREPTKEEWDEYLAYEAAETAKAEKAAKAKKKVVGDDLREYVRDHGIVRADEDGNEITGNIEYRLSEPIEVEGEKYYGMELRKQQPITFDTDAARSGGQPDSSKSFSVVAWSRSPAVASALMTNGDGRL